MIEKLNIKNRPDKATRLQQCRDIVINEEEENGFQKVCILYNVPNEQLYRILSHFDFQKHLIYDIFSMLINAANNPVNSEYDSSIGKEPAQEENVTWQSIVAEEPLTGSHWEQWESISTDDDSDTDDRDDEAEGSSLVETTKACSYSKDALLCLLELMKICSHIEASRT